MSNIPVAKKRQKQLQVKSAWLKSLPASLVHQRKASVRLLGAGWKLPIDQKLPFFYMVQQHALHCYDFQNPVYLQLA
jgi:hypothetical protein